MWARWSGQLVWVSRRARRTETATVTAAKRMPATMRRRPGSAPRRRARALGPSDTVLVRCGRAFLAPALLERLLRRLLPELLRFLRALHRASVPRVVPGPGACAH